MGFPTVRIAGRRDNAAVQGRFEVALFRAGGVRAAVLRLRVGTGAKGADCRIFASLFEVAKLPAVTALCERGGRVGVFDNLIFAVEQGEGGVSHPPTMFSGDLHHHRAGILSDRTRLAVGVEVAGSLNNEALGVVDRSGEGRGKEGVVIWHAVEGKAVNGELEVGGGEAESLPRVVSDGEELIEAGGEGLKKGGLGGGGDESVDNGEGDGALAIDKGLERNLKLGVHFSEDGGSNVREADRDKGFVRVRGMRSAGGIEPSGSAREGSRALRRRGLHDGRDFGRCSPRAGGALAFSLAFCSILGCGLVEITSASVDDGSVGGAGGGGTRMGRGSVGRDRPGWARRGCLG